MQLPVRATEAYRIIFSPEMEKATADFLAGKITKAEYAAIANNNHENIKFIPASDRPIVMIDIGG